MLDWDHIDRVAACYAHDHHADPDEYVAQARYAVLVELDRKPELEHATPQLLGVIVRRRLCDWHRREHGRRSDRWTVPLELVPEPMLEQPLPEGFAGWLCDLIDRHAPDGKRSLSTDEWHRLIDDIAHGEPRQSAADRIGVDVTRISQHVAELRRWADACREEWYAA